MTAGEVFTGILSLFGVGAIPAMVVGYLAYKKEAAIGRRDTLRSSDLTQASGHFPGSADIELLTNAVSQLRAGLLRLTAVMEFRFVREDCHDDFEEWAARQEILELRNQLSSLRDKR